MFLVPPELWENRSLPPPPFKNIIKSKDHSYNKCTKIRLRQDLYLKNEKRKREPIPIPITETLDRKRKRVFGSVPLFKTESESETDISPAHSRYIQDVLTRKESNDPTFGVYQDDTDGSFKIGRSSFKYNNKHVFVDGKKYKATQELWEFLTQSRPDKHLVTNQDKQAYKQILLQSNAHRVNHSSSGKIRANKGLKYT